MISNTVTKRIDAIVREKVKIPDLRHPLYQESVAEWIKWRLTYDSGDEYIEKYLQRFTKREVPTEFDARKSITYVPAFAKSGVKEVKDSIFQRITDVTRENGPQSYQDAVNGKNRGVDLKGCNMNSFIGRHVLPDLLALGKVGVFVDMPSIDGPTLASKGQARPYIYTYKAEDILNWVVDNTYSDAEFKSLLLRDHVYATDDTTGLPTEDEERYRLMWVEDGIVLYQFFNKESQPINADGEVSIDIGEIKLPTIPFVQFDIAESLLKDVANYQIALLNLASADVSYSLRANFPFYIEQFDPKSEGIWNRSPAAGDTTDDDNVTIVKQGQSQDAATSKNKEIRVGATSGRRVPKGLLMPEFIHPSPEPLIASMAKQDELKSDIRHLIKLAVSQLSPKMASAESKQQDNQSLEAGLSAIGLELEHGERCIARYWTSYEDKSGDQPTVTYPQRYRLVSDKDKRDEAKELRESAKSVPSQTYRKEAVKKIATINLGTTISDKTLEQIHNDIDEAEIVVVDSKELKEHIEIGIIDPETASIAVGYPKGSVEKASKAHAERVKRIAESQGQARGTTDLGGLANSSKEEKQETAGVTNPATDSTRGGGK